MVGAACRLFEMVFSLLSVKSSLLLCAAHLARSSSSILLRIAVLRKQSSISWLPASRLRLLMPSGISTRGNLGNDVQVDVLFRLFAARRALADGEPSLAEADSFLGGTAWSRRSDPDVIASDLFDLRVARLGSGNFPSYSSRSCPAPSRYSRGSQVAR